MCSPGLLVGDRSFDQGWIPPGLDSWLSAEGPRSSQATRGEQSSQKARGQLAVVFDCLDRRSFELSAVDTRYIVPN